MLTIVAAMIIFDYLNSSTDNNLHNIEPIMMPLAKISNDPTIQSTYERCRNNIVSDFKKDNLEMPKDMLIMTLQSMPDICKDSIKTSCKGGASHKMCKFIIQAYQ